MATFSELLKQTIKQLNGKLVIKGEEKEKQKNNSSNDDLNEIFENIVNTAMKENDNTIRLKILTQVNNVLGRQIKEGEGEIKLQKNELITAFISIYKGKNNLTLDKDWYDPTALKNKKEELFNYCQKNVPNLIKKITGKVKTKQGKELLIKV